MQCPKCGTENRDSAKFCDECGYELPTVAPYAREMFSQDALGVPPAAGAGAGAASAAVAGAVAGVVSDAGAAGGSDDEFAALFNDSGTVKLTHIAEKLRKPESSGSFVTIPEDESGLSDGIRSGGPQAHDDLFLDFDEDELTDEEAGAVTADLPDAALDDLEDDLLVSAADDSYPDIDEFPELDGRESRSMFEDIGEFAVSKTAAGISDIDDFGEDEIVGSSEEDIYSVDTAPLLTSDVHHAIEEDDLSTMVAANAALAAHTQRMQAQQGSGRASASAFETSAMDMQTVMPGNGAPKDAHSFLAFSAKRKHRFSKRFKTGFVITLCAIAAVAAILGITYALQIWGGKTIPDVVGASSSDAKYLLEESGFLVEEKPIVSDDVEGLVIEVWPEPGSRQPLGSTVTIGVSVFRVIPDVVGLSLEAAQDLLGEYGYTDIELVMKKSDEDEGSILSVNPAVGTRANAETHVTIEVAQPYLVPDVVGDSKEEAINVLASEGFTAEVTYDYSNTDPEGSVMRTVPAAGDPCKTTTPVQIVIAVSRATELGNLTSELFAGVDTLTYNGNMYQYVKGSFAVVSCPDNNTLNFTIRGRLLDMHTWPDGRTDTWVGNEVTIASTAGWSDSNEFLYMDPNLLN